MSTQPLLLDLFCGAGGAGTGYARAGFRVVGVDLNPKPLRHNPHECYVGDALEVLDTLLAGETWQGYRMGDFAVIHASPPCQAYSASRSQNLDRVGTHPKLIEPVRQRLQASGVPWVIENVVGAPMGHFAVLCGTHFGLNVYRHRRFESSMMLFAPQACSHPARLLPGFLCIYGHEQRGPKVKGHRVKYRVTDAKAAMGIDWMNRGELSQAIPPAYTTWIGAQLMTVLEVAA